MPVSGYQWIILFKCLPQNLKLTLAPLSAECPFGYTKALSKFFIIIIWKPSFRPPSLARDVFVRAAHVRDIRRIYPRTIDYIRWRCHRSSRFIIYYCVSLRRIQTIVPVHNVFPRVVYWHTAPGTWPKFEKCSSVLSTSNFEINTPSHTNTHTICITTKYNTF